MRRNVANQKIAAQLVSKTDGSDVTSGTTTVYVTIDAGSQASLGSATHEGNGCWTIDTGVAGNTDGEHLAFTFVNTSAVSQTVNVYTSVPQTGDSYARIGANGVGLTETNLVDAAMQDIARMIYPALSVQFVNTGGNDANNGTRPSKAKALPSTAAGSAGNAGAIVVANGAYVETVTIALTDYQSLIGGGQFATEIQSNLPLSTAPIINWSAGKNIEIHNIRSTGTLTDGTTQATFGVISPATARVAGLFNISGNADTDNFYTFGLATKIPTTYIRNAAFVGKWDQVAVFQNSKLRMSDSWLESNGPTAGSQPQNGGGMQVSGGNANAWLKDTVLYAENGGSTNTYGVLLGSTAKARFFSCQIITSASTSPQDVLITGTGTVTLSDTVYDTSKTTVGTGTLTIANKPISQAGQISNGAITSQSFAAGAIDAAAIAPDAIASSELATTAAQEIATLVSSSAVTAADVWTYATRALTEGVARVVQQHQTGALTIVRGDTYLNADGTAITITKATGATWPTNLTGWTISVTLRPTALTLRDYPAGPSSVTGSNTAVVTPTGDSQAIRFDLATTSTLIPGGGTYKYDVQASSGSSRATLETGTVTVVEDQTTG